MKRTTVVVGLGLLLATPALGAEEAAPERSPRALEILNKADAAIRSVHAVRYAMSTRPDGIAAEFFSPAEGTATLAGWSDGMPAKFLVHIETTRPGGNEAVELTGGGDGGTFFLIDHRQKKVYGSIDRAASNLLHSVGMLEFVEQAPFDDELKADVVEFVGSEKVGREKCYKIRVVYGGGAAESTWFFSEKDFLPRRRIRHFSTPRGEGTFDSTLTKLETDPALTDDLFAMQLPEGYERVDDPAP